MTLNLHLIAEPLFPRAHCDPFANLDIACLHIFGLIQPSSLLCALIHFDLNHQIRGQLAFITSDISATGRPSRCLDGAAAGEQSEPFIHPQGTVSCPFAYAQGLSQPLISWRSMHVHIQGTLTHLRCYQGANKQSASPALIKGCIYTLYCLPDIFQHTSTRKRCR